MKTSISILLVVGVIFGAVACNGPAFPQRDGRAYLERHGYSSEVIDAVLGGGPLQHDQVVKFSRCGSADVRFLVGGNRTLNPDEIDLFIHDSDDYARSGTAHNPSLTTAQMERLFRDSSHTVYAGLAGNPSVPKEMLLRLHAERKPGLVWFAMNPKCPPEIAKEIGESGDDLAKHWLGIRKQVQSETVGATTGKP